VIDKAQSVLRDAIADDPSFHQYLLPDFDPPNCPIAKVTSLKTKKMSTKRFLVYISEMLTGPPYDIDQSELKALTGHVFRHGLVTIGERTMLDPHVLARLGLWSGHDAQPSSKSQSRLMAMPMLYSDERMATQATGRTELVRATRKAAMAHVRMDLGHNAKKLCLAAWSRHPAFNPSLDDLVPHWPDSKAVTRETADFIRSKLSEGVSTPGELEQAIADGEEKQRRWDLPIADEEELESPSCSDSSSPPASSENSEDPETMCWMCAQKPGSRLHLVDTSAELYVDGTVSMCGRKLSMAVVGWGVQEALSHDRQWSPRCRAQLPAAVRELWQCGT